MAERNVEGTEAETRFKFGDGYKPAFPAEVGYGGYVGARDSDNAPLRSYKAVLAAAILFVVVLGGVLIFVLLD